MKLVFPTLYCPNKRTIGLAAKSLADMAEVPNLVNWLIRSTGSIFFLYIFLRPLKIMSLSKLDRSGWFCDCCCE